MSLEPNENLRLRSDYPDYSKPIGDGVAQALQDYAAAHRLMMENISLRQQLAEKDAEIEEIKGGMAYRNSLLCRIETERDELRQQLAEKDAEIMRLHFEQEQYGPDKLAIQKQAWVEADRQRQINEFRQQLAASKAREQQYLESLKAADDCIKFYSHPGSKLVAQAIAIPSDTSALEDLIAKAGEVMRENAAVAAWIHYAEVCKTKRLNPHHYGEWIASEAIRALPGVTLEDLK